jgi:hypothetical protein
MYKVMVSKDEMHSKKMDLVSDVVDGLDELADMINHMDNSSMKSALTLKFHSIYGVADNLKTIIFKEAVDEQ